MLADCPCPGTTGLSHLAAKHAVVTCGVASGRFASKAAAHWRWRAGQDPGQSRIGARTYVFTLHRSKTDQSGTNGHDNDKPIVGTAADALDKWLERSGVKSGAIFRRIRRGDNVGEPLSPAAVRDIVKSRALMAGLEEEFSAHSLRSGFVTEAAHQGVPIGETMSLTGHTSVATVVGYFRSASAIGSKAARLLDEGS